jgi:hypothetical protein
LVKEITPVSHQMKAVAPRGEGGEVEEGEGDVVRKNNKYQLYIDKLNEVLPTLKGFEQELVSRAVEEYKAMQSRDNAPDRSFEEVIHEVGVRLITGKTSAGVGSFIDLAGEMWLYVDDSVTKWFDQNQTHLKASANVAVGMVSSRVASAISSVLSDEFKDQAKTAVNVALEANAELDSRLAPGQRAIKKMELEAVVLSFMAKTIGITSEVVSASADFVAEKAAFNKMASKIASKAEAVAVGAEVGVKVAVSELDHYGMKYAAEHNWPDLLKAIESLPEGYVFHGEAKGGKTVGLVFKNGPHEITIKKAKLDAKYASQRVDYVSYTKHGSQHITADGGIIYLDSNNGRMMRKTSEAARAVEIPAEEVLRLNLNRPEYHPDVHISLDDFIKKFGVKK